MQRAHTRLLHDTIVITDHLFSDLFSIQMVVDMECEVSSIASAHGALHCFEYALGHGFNDLSVVHNSASASEGSYQLRSPLSGYKHLPCFQDPAICQLRKTRLRDQTDADSRDLVDDLDYLVETSDKAIDNALCESYYGVDSALKCTAYCRTDLNADVLEDAADLIPDSAEERAYA